jgi:hypothetical protein
VDLDPHNVVMSNARLLMGAVLTKQQEQCEMRFLDAYRPH